MIPCAIFAIGAELLEGSITDTNSSFISKHLTAAGFSPQLITLLPDDKEIISLSVKSAMQRFPIVVTTGGLGPTFDDLTSEAVAQACGVTTALFTEAERVLTERLNRLNVKINKNHLRQAFLPEGSKLFRNSYGTACGFCVTAYGSIIISMPGVPYEMRSMLNDGVIPFLKERFSPKEPFMIDLRFGNAPESDVDSVICGLGIPKGVTCIINAGMGEVTVKIRDGGSNGGKQFAEKVKAALNHCYIGQNDENPAATALRLLNERGLTLSVAESCTGGLLSGLVTSAAGASKSFVGGVISYDNKVKIEQLRVPESLLQKSGAVSEECAVAMAKGVRALLDTDCAIAITGIAGPAGGTPDKPVGTVYIAVAIGEKVECRRFFLSGDRTAVREKAVKNALYMLIRAC